MKTLPHDKKGKGAQKKEMEGLYFQGYEKGIQIDQDDREERGKDRPSPGEIVQGQRAVFHGEDHEGQVPSIEEQALEPHTGIER